VAVARELQQIAEGSEVRIKWPNDIMVDDKKAGGILIENTVRGQRWQWAVAGIGLNVGQPALPAYLPHATSLRIAIGHRFDIESLAGRLRGRVLQTLSAKPEDIAAWYHELLFQLGGRQQFAQDGNTWEGMVCGVNDRGQLLVRLRDGSMQAYTHGSVEWVWGN
jgi:BirA family biotin operon repressor/biotin-[acetyl-CoA-carboxylase] ligase